MRSVSLDDLVYLTCISLPDVDLDTVQSGPDGEVDDFDDEDVDDASDIEDVQIQPGDALVVVAKTEEVRKKRKRNRFKKSNVSMQYVN